MRILLLILIAMSEVLAFNSFEHVNINRRDFTLIKDSYDIYDSKGTVMKLYSEENNKDLIFILSLILHDSTGSCANKSVENGTYVIQDSNITLYHSWNRVGRAYDAPYGAMIDKYMIDRGGKLQKLSSKVYIESSRKNYDPKSGMKYLFKKPQNQQQKDQLKDYIKSIEKKYKSSFVFGDEAKKLIKDVKDALDKGIWGKK